MLGLRRAMLGAGAPWSPKKLGALFTLDPDKIDAGRIISGAVDSANDAFGGSVVLQAPTSGQRPTYDTVNTKNGHKAVSHIVASNTALRTATGGVTGVHDHSIVLVGQFNSYNGSFQSAAVMGTPSSGNSVAGVSSSGTYWLGGNGLTTPTLSYDTGFHVFEKSYASTGTEMKAWIDGAKELTNTSTTLNLANAGFGFGGWSAGGVADYRCWYALWLDRVMTMTERRKLMSWLKSHFALSLIPAIVHDGDSLTAGGGAGNPVNSDYPYQMVSLITNTYRKYNSGIGGQKSSDLLTDITTAVDELVTPIRKANVYMLWIGHNDLVAGTSAATIWANIQTLVAGRRAAGFDKIALFTIIPGQDITNQNQDTNRQSLNTLIRNGWAAIADALVDVDADARLQNPQDATYFNADTIHLNPTGYGVVASLAAPQVNGWVPA